MDIGILACGGKAANARRVRDHDFICARPLYLMRRRSILSIQHTAKPTERGRPRNARRHDLVCRMLVLYARDKVRSPDYACWGERRGAAVVQMKMDLMNVVS